MIVYFTGTGNSRWVAEKISLIIGDEVVNSFEYIRSQKKAELHSERPFVFVCPTRSEERRVGKECRSRWSPYH